MIQNAKIVGENVSYATYSRQTVRRGDLRFIMSRGELMTFADCPHKWLSGFEKADTKATDWGQLIDALALSRKQFGDRIAICPETYQPEKGEPKPWNFNATVCREWKKQQAGKVIVKARDVEAAHAAVNLLREHQPTRTLLACSRKQVMVTAEYLDDVTGLVVPVRALIDLVPDKAHPVWGKALADLKTAASASPGEFTNAVYYNDYDAQAALYLDLYVAATDEDRVDWVFAVQENGEPYEIPDHLPLLSAEFLTIGRDKYQNALRFYCQCLERMRWPSYGIGNRRSWNGTYTIEPTDRMVESQMIRTLEAASSEPEDVKPAEPIGVTP